MFTPGCPKLSHPGLLHATSSIALIAQVYAADKPLHLQAFEGDRSTVTDASTAGTWSNSPRRPDNEFGTDRALAPIGGIIGVKMANELRAVVDELGGEAVLGRRLNRDVDLQAAIREGFPQKVIEELMEAADLSINELAACLDLSVRSLQRRRREGRLARYESDRIYRLARIVALAKSSLGGRDPATRWLKRPNRALGGKAPLAVIDTELGARAVENVLGRIAFGGVS